LLLWCLVCGLPWGADVGAAGVPELKAAFILNFAKLTRWPKPTQQGLEVCFATVAEPVGAALAEHGETGVNEATLQVRRGVGLKELAGCGIVYLGAADEYRSREILAKLHDQPVLTISDMSGFNQAGGMIELFLEQGKLRFAVNLVAVERAGIEINARLLGLARGVIRE
jgi:hypothetical protein